MDNSVSVDSFAHGETAVTIKTQNISSPPEVPFIFLQPIGTHRPAKLQQISLHSPILRKWHHTAALMSGFIRCMTTTPVPRMSSLFPLLLSGSPSY